MLHHCVLAFTAGREALGQWGGAHGLSWESGGNEEEYFRSILSALCMQRRRLCHICCPSYERLVHLPDWPFVCTFSPESRGLMLKFFPLHPIVNPGSSVCALSASTCPTSMAPCKPAPPAQAMGQGATSRRGPWGMESPARSPMLFSNHPQLFGELICGFPLRTVYVPVQQCLRRWMFGIPQGIFDPCPANPDGYASACSICIARCQMNEWSERLKSAGAARVVPENSPPGSARGPGHEPKRPHLRVQRLAWPAGCSVPVFFMEITNRIILGICHMEGLRLYLSYGLVMPT